MAFNPFDFFRRNQKIFFSILTVIVMFMFVLSFGKGDFFDSFSRWVGTRANKGEVVATVDSTKVRLSELEQITYRRNLAQNFLGELRNKAYMKLYQQVNEGAQKGGVMCKAVLGQFLQLVQQGYQDPNNREDPETILVQLQSRFAEIVSKPKDLSETDLAAFRAAFYMVQIDMNGARSFVRDGAGNEDSFNFLLWLKKADRLGINISADELGQLVEAECGTKVTKADQAEIMTKLNQSMKGNAELVQKALLDEFRVRAARIAVAGREESRPYAAMAEAPLSYYKRYRELCERGRYEVVALPVDLFLDQVTEEPKQPELQTLFNERKSQEPDPESRLPGFRTPRRIKVEWMEVKNDSDFYKAATEEAFRTGDVASKLGGAFANAFVATPTGILSGSVLLVKPDALYESTYKDHLRTAEMDNYSSWFEKNPFNARPSGKSLGSAGGISALVTTLAGSQGRHPLAALNGFVGAASVEDRRMKLQSLTGSLYVPLSTGLPAASFGTIAAQAQATEPESITALRPTLIMKVKEQLRSQIASNDVKAFEKKLGTLGSDLKNAKNDADKTKAEADVRNHVDSFLKSRGFPSGRMTEYRDLLSLSSEPALAPLWEAATANPFRPTRQFLTPRNFGTPFFNDYDFSSKPFRMRESTDLYKSKPFTSSFQFWRIADKPGETPRTLEDPLVREMVRQAWRREKARGLAKAAAEEFAKKCGSLGKNFLEINPKFLDMHAELSAKFKGRYIARFDIDNVAPVVAPTIDDQIEQMQRGNRQPLSYDFRLRPNENIPYPSDSMRKELLENKDKALSTAIVLSDKGDNCYYTAVLSERQTLDTVEFRAIYKQHIQGTDPTARQLASRRRTELVQESRKQAIELLKAEFRCVVEKPEKLTEKGSSSAGDFEE